MKSTEPLYNIPLNQIALSETNQRATSGLDEASLRELGNSILQEGLIQPLLLRPTPGQDKPYQVVCGERRVSAALLVGGIAMLQARVLEIPDHLVRRIQIIENLQRAGLNPIEEASGYFDLLKQPPQPGQPQATIDSIAAEVKTSPSTIRARLKLLKLPKDAQAGLASGQLDHSMALLAARIPDPAQQAVFLKRITAKDRDGESLSYRDAKKLAQNEYMRRLKDAPFDQKDPNLVPAQGQPDEKGRTGCGPCANCIHRTGNMKDLFPDVKSEDVCTLPSCYARKCQLSRDAQLCAAKTAGQEILKPTASEPLFQKQWDDEHYTLNWTAQETYVDLEADAPAENQDQQKPWRAALGPALPTPILAPDADGRVHLLLKRADAIAAAKKAGVKLSAHFTQESGSHSSDAERKRNAAHNRKQKFYQQLQRTLSLKLVAQCENDSTIQRFNDPRSLEWHRLLTQAALDMTGQLTRHEIVIRRGLNLDAQGKRRTGVDDEKELDALCAGLKTESELRGLLFEALVIQKPAYSAWGGEDIFPKAYKTAAKFYHVDIAAEKQKLQDAEQQKTEGRNQKSEIRDQNAEVRRQKKKKIGN